MSDSNDDRRTSTEANTSGGANNPQEAAAADIDSGTGVGDNSRTDDRDPGPGNESTQVASEARRRNTSFVSALVAIVGAWVALSVLVYDVGGATLWNNVLVGAVVVAAAGYNYYRLANDIPLSVGVASLVAVLGIWLIVSAALFEMIGGMFWSTIVSGLLVAGLAGYNAYEAREARAVTGGETRA